jgi:hypothetical protein
LAGVDKAEVLQNLSSEDFSCFVTVGVGSIAGSGDHDE